MFAVTARKHLRLMLVVMGLALLAGGAIYWFSRPVFHSRSLVRVDETVTGERLRALARELTQPQILERTASRLGVKATASDLRENFLFNIVVRVVSERELEVEVWCYSKSWAERWTEALVNELVDFRRVRRRKETADAIKTLNREMTEIAATLGDSGAQKFFATDKQGLAMGLEELNRLCNSTRELERLGRRIEEMGRVRADLQDPGISVVEKLSLIAAVDESAGKESGDAAAPTAAPWEIIEKRRRALSALIDGVPDNRLADDATLLALNAQMEELDRKLQSELDADYRRFDVDYRNMVDQKAALEAKSAQRNGPADSALNVQLRHIAERIETIDATGSGDGVIPMFAGILQISDRPVAPDPLKIALCSLLGGGVLALGAPFLVERLGYGQPKLAQLESALRLPGLGTIPTHEKLPPYTPPPFTELGEPFRAIRTRLLAAGTPHVLMVASAMPAEGRTTVAANLAMTFAQTGARTLLIDTDLQRGSLHRFFGHRKAPGLSNVLLGEIPLEPAIRATLHDNLSVLHAGKPVTTGTALLASDAFAAAMIALRERHDIIVLDTPPVLGLAETFVMQRHVDGVLFVIADDRTPKRPIGAAIDLLRARGANVIGFVMNRAKAGKPSK